MPRASRWFASDASHVWFVMHVFLAVPHPCTEVAVNVADVLEDGENNNADELATPRRPGKGRRVATIKAKFVLASQGVKPRDWTRATLSHCLDLLGVKVPSGSNRQQAREIAMQHALACWHTGMPLCLIRTA